MQVVGNETRYSFNEADGPVCLRGGRFVMSTRDTGSQDLMIYLQGGGSCTTALCRATETAATMMPSYGVLNATDQQNPVSTWNVVFSPYCDGSLHFGDSDIPDQNRKHHGLRNLSASLDVAKAKFPNPRRILLTGASAGGYATIWATALVRLVYPDAKLFVFNDAGIAISNPANPEGFRSVLGEWGAQQFIPATCDACKTSPHLTAWMSWNLQRDPGITLGMFSAYQDSVISGTFLMLDPAVFQQALLDETAKVVDTAPTRAKRFLVQGVQHTVGNIQTTAVNGVSVAQWLGRMLEGDPAWDNVLQ
ncbi:MAG TPA: pectin acetylesterase-family hydrolase [Polyangiales bacterium]|nr:pectin acetylesterase-family hydrolase [Polyangiales bacterium]